MQQLVVISGCSGGGKSTLLEALRRRGYAVVEEPGRRVLAEQSRNAGDGLPWVDMAAFLHEALRVARLDLERVASATGPVFFGLSMSHTLGGLQPYGRLVFLTPPWPDIYRVDEQRRHGFAEAVAEYTHLEATYKTLGYDVRILPRAGVADRTDFVLQALHRG